MQKLRVTYQDGRTVDVFVPPKAMVMVERTYNVSLTDEKARRLEHSYYLAWQSLFLAGREPRDFEAFLMAMEDVDDITEEEAAANGQDPTGTAPTLETGPTPSPLESSV